MLFSSWSSLAQVALVGVLAYGVLVLVLRVSGKRTLSKMNAFDLVVTVALGSTLASVLLSRTVPLADGVVALILLVALQYAVAWTTLRAGWFRRLVKSEPALLVRGGEFLEDAMRRERVARDEVLAAIRNQGIEALSEVRAVVLETDGSFSVLRGGGPPSGRTSLADVPGVDHPGAPT